MTQDDQKIFGKNPNPEFLDLRIGNPGIMEELWAKIELPANFKSKYTMEYIQDGIDELTREIVLTHMDFENLDDSIIKRKNVIVGNGATHMIQAALYALKKLGYRRIVTKAPYWPRFKSIANMHDIPIHIVDKKDANSPPRLVNDIVITTSPNNPDGSVGASLDNTIIWDASYNWPQYYTRNGHLKRISSPITIFSLAKATGHASTRIGWAVVTMDDVAAEMKQYIEMTTSGISIEAQIKACEVLFAFRGRKDELTHAVKKILATRRNYLKSIKIGQYDTLFYTEGQGMFEYLVVNYKYESVFDEIGVSTVRGDSFGDGPEFHRINLACHTPMWESFKKKLEGYVSKYAKR